METRYARYRFISHSIRSYYNAKIVLLFNSIAHPTFAVGVSAVVRVRVYCSAQMRLVRVA